MKVAYSIILNGLHHLKHNDYAQFILDHFDYWIVAEGAARNSGSTSWCKPMPDGYHNNGKSIDGTLEFLEDLATQFPRLKLLKADGLWQSKDVMCNAVIDCLSGITNECFLFQIDIDEQWSMEGIQSAIDEMKVSNARIGYCYFNQYVGKDLIASGDWGSNHVNRVTHWRGEKYKSHEPVVWEGGNEPSVFLSYKFEHYSYYFEEDVKFKDEWYGRHEGVYQNWLKLQKETRFPQPIQYLFPRWKGYRSTIRKTE